MKILVSQPGRQYTHHLVYALQKSKYLQVFLTSVWYKPALPVFRLLRRLPFWKKGLEPIFRKRYHPLLEEDKIRLFPWFELFRQLLVVLFKLSSESWVFMVERRHDAHVSKQLKKYQPDVVFAYEKAALKTFQAAKKKGMICVLDLAQVHYKHIAQLRTKYPTFATMMHDSLFNRISKVKQQELQLADYVLTLSSYARNTLINAGMDAQKIVTINLGFDPTKFSPKETYRQSGKFKLLFVGTITRRKGIHLLLETFRQLNLAEAELTIIGPILDAGDILERYKGSYTYYPFMHHEELAEQYREADVFVFPSYLDSWAMTVVEAMACGTPVIVSEHTGAKDAVAQGGGFIIPLNDIDAITQSLQSLYDDRKKVEEMGRKAAEVAANYTWNTYEKEIKGFVDHMIKQGGPHE